MRLKSLLDIVGKALVGTGAVIAFTVIGAIIVLEAESWQQFGVWFGAWLSVTGCVCGMASTFCD